ncbi:MAG: MBL fold metallo-hydrolase [Bacilli bacterium]|nr:MBL fold metallo-hydrolase [Bacilli bacterium]
MNNNEIKNTGENKLYYLGHASLRITTREGKVIYVDPYMGDDYDMAADLVLVTHDHYDHNEVSKVKNKTSDYKLITNKDGLVDGEYKSFDLGYAKIEAVEAGYNRYHNEKECVGYVITLSDETKIYIAGDTAITSMMDKLGTYNIDYAFIPCDGKYTMSVEDAIKASQKIKAKHNIPYHMVSDGRGYDDEVASKFKMDNWIIVKQKEEIILKHD